MSQQNATSEPATPAGTPRTASQERRRPDLREAITEIGIRLIPALLDAILDHLRSARPLRRDTLSLGDVFQFFAANRAASPRAAAGAVVRTDDPGGTLVLLMFLDTDHTPLVSGPGAAPVGAFLVKNLDPELEAAFGTKNVIVID